MKSVLDGCEWMKVVSYYELCPLRSLDFYPLSSSMLHFYYRLVCRNASSITVSSSLFMILSNMWASGYANPTALWHLLCPCVWRTWTLCCYFMLTSEFWLRIKLSFTILFLRGRVQKSISQQVCTKESSGEIGVVWHERNARRIMFTLCQKRFLSSINEHRC
jgi:hypothetical protein